jgi:hypothetical protein
VEPPGKRVESLPPGRETRNERAGIHRRPSGLEIRQTLEDQITDIPADCFVYQRWEY